MFGGAVRRYKHFSKSCGCDMTFSVFVPPAALAETGGEGEGGGSSKKAGGAPVLLFLSGLTCSDENFTQKAGAQRAAAARGIALAAPDTSPRGLRVPGEDEGWDLGTGAGFYVDATAEPWVVKKNDEKGGDEKSSSGYRMFSYVTVDLLEALRAVPGLAAEEGKIALSGHSMGGHGALVLGLRRPDLFCSVSALAPICNPCRAPWGRKAFSAYLGGGGGGGGGGEGEKGEEEAEKGDDDNIPESWRSYDACELLKTYKGPARSILVDYGSADEFLEGQLRPLSLEEAARAASSSGSAEGGSVSLVVREQKGYDHSYFFIASFIDDHVEHAARALLSCEK